MASLPPFRQLNASTIKDAPAWFGLFLQQFNNFTSTVYDALDRSLSFGANIPAQYATLPYTVPPGGYPAYSVGTLSFACTLRAKAACVLLAQVRRNGAPAAGTTESAISLNQWSTDGSRIIVDSIAGLVPGVTYTLTFMVL